MHKLLSSIFLCVAVGDVSCAWLRTGAVWFCMLFLPALVIRSRTLFTVFRKWTILTVASWSTHSLFISASVCTENMTMSLCFIEAPRHLDVRCGGIAPRILNLGTGWRWVVTFTPRALYPWHSLDRRPDLVLDGLVKRKILSLSLPGIEPLSSSP
jgi:hypothetical protein